MSHADFLARTRDSYDAIAADYAEWVGGELAAKPLDRAVLRGFAELVQSGDSGPVIDVGCGPGRIAAYLHDLGLRVRGFDLSARMVDIARASCPGVRFDVGSMLALDLPDAGCGGAVAWYSIIHVPQQRLGEVFAELARVLAPGGWLQLAFQIGDETRHLSQAAGHDVALDFHRRSVDAVAAQLGYHGFAVRARMVRAPDEDGDFPEQTPQGFVLARRDSVDDAG